MAVIVDRRARFLVGQETLPCQRVPTRSRWTTKDPLRRAMAVGLMARGASDGAAVYTTAIISWGIRISRRSRTCITTGDPIITLVIARCSGWTAISLPTFGPIQRMAGATDAACLDMGVSCVGVGGGSATLLAKDVVLA